MKYQRDVFKKKFYNRSWFVQHSKTVYLILEDYFEVQIEHWVCTIIDSREIKSISEGLVRTEQADEIWLHT